jgi:hypothetical protein
LARLEKYLLTVDSETGSPVKIEHMGEAGELTEVPLENLRVLDPSLPAPQVVNVYIGGAPVSEIQGTTAALGAGPPPRGGTPRPPVAIFQGNIPPKPPKGGGPKPGPKTGEGQGESD